MDNNCLKYIKISKSQVLLHPNPQGVIQFIGSFIFGSFPACTYKYLHQFLFDRGYSLILYNFPLNPTQFNHWEVAINLLEEQHKLRSKIIEILKADDSPIETLRERDRGLIDIYLNPANHPAHGARAHISTEQSPDTDSEHHRASSRPYAADCYAPPTIARAWSAFGGAQVFGG